MPRVAIIEDDKDFAEILKECLEEDGENEVVVMLDNEQDALNWIEQYDLSTLDCALVDLVIPKVPGALGATSMAGLRIVEQLRHAKGFYGTILVLTNSRLFEDGQRALSAGCDGYLCKHAKMEDIPAMVSELKLALNGQVMLVSREMRHVFIREELSSKEARLMSLLNEGHTWAEIATELGYKTGKAAATIGYRVFDKILTPYDLQSMSESTQEAKRIRALERWRARMGQAPKTNSGSSPSIPNEDSISPEMQGAAL